MKKDIAVQHAAADKYLHTSATLKQVADEYGVSEPTVRNWAMKRNPALYPTAKGRNRQLLQAQDIVEVIPNIRRGEVADMVGVSRRTVDRWVKQNKLSLELVCDICEEPSTTKYCRDCASKNWPRIYKTYGLTHRQLQELPNECAVCGASDRLNIDHDHSTGKYRGVLCYNCNLALGHVKDKIQTLENLIKYLKKNNN